MSLTLGSELLFGPFTSTFSLPPGVCLPSGPTSTGVATLKFVGFAAGGLCSPGPAAEHLDARFSGLTFTLNGLPGTSVSSSLTVTVYSPGSSGVNSQSYVPSGFCVIVGLAVVFGPATVTVRSPALNSGVLHSNLVGVFTVPSFGALIEHSFARGGLNLTCGK